MALIYSSSLLFLNKSPQPHWNKGFARSKPNGIFQIKIIMFLFSLSSLTASPRTASMQSFTDSESVRGLHHWVWLRIHATWREATPVLLRTDHLYLLLLIHRVAVHFDSSSIWAHGICSIEVWAMCDAVPSQMVFFTDCDSLVADQTYLLWSHITKYILHSLTLIK